jgi:hypothetical protein
MSIDRFYTKVDGKWVHIDPVVPLVIDEHGHVSCSNEIPEPPTDFWVDICHGGPYLIDERYYFPDLASALEFYRHGWEERQFHDDDGQPCGLDHSGLYSRGRLIQGLSIYCEAPGHEGENLQRISKEYAKKTSEKEEGEQSRPDEPGDGG